MKFFCLSSRPAAGGGTVAILCALLLGACDKPAEPAPAPASAATSSAPPPEPPPVGETGTPEPEPTVPASGSSLETYRTSIRDIKLFMESHQSETDPAKALDRLRELVIRISAIKTDDLPADLAASFKTVRTSMQRIQTAFDALPVPVNQFEDWMAAETAKGEDAAAAAQAKMDQFIKTMSDVQAEIEPAGKAMNETGAKYGVDPLDLNGQ
ncbi:MAG: hypothetical protein JWM59_2658 [Verrucomicrobiales bacterium]|nr:hypothetical protein [Verrucomicrobiales bacterium]